MYLCKCNKLISALFINSKIIIPLRTTLHEMGYKQSPTPVQTDNEVALLFATNTIKNHSKVISMNYYWVQDQQHNNNLNVHWKPKEFNIADYFTKNHPPIVHKRHRPILLLQENSPKAPFTNHLHHAERVCWDLISGPLQTIHIFIHIASLSPYIFTHLQHYVVLPP